MEVVKITGTKPNKLPWVEGVNYECLAGDPQDNDLVRVRKYDEKGYVVFEEFRTQYTPPPADQPEKLARNLTWDQFLDVAMATDASATNAILLNMPVVAEFGRKYLTTPGIVYADVTDPNARLARLMVAAKSAGLIGDTFVTAFLENWQDMFSVSVNPT